MHIIADDFCNAIYITHEKTSNVRAVSAGAVGGELEGWVEDCSEIRGDSELHLLHKDAFESGNIVSLVEKKHSHFIIDGIYGAEGEGAVAMSNENTIRTNASRSLISIHKCLNI